MAGGGVLRRAGHLGGGGALPTVLDRGDVVQAADPRVCRSGVAAVCRLHAVAARLAVCLCRPPERYAPGVREHCHRDPGECQSDPCLRHQRRVRIAAASLPPVAVVIPIYVMFQRLSLLDTRAALIITYTAVNLPIVVWLMRDYFRNISLELEESAAIDGASPYRIFWSIVLPLATPGLAATFLLVLVFSWNEYLFALFLTSANAQTLPLSIAAQNATRGPMWWYMSVLILIMITPVIAMAIALERYIAKGLLVGALKG